ncbi:exportin-5-like protein [Achlya hypogyna]|uniref:Exportin-5-like protein n=1 Tax=Achlya hypogyna TaxID=1202772 RepID=A0A1V9Z421_ACHHY|nr:exportin-5-like protein [Achlya hypogyna]
MDEHVYEQLLRAVDVSHAPDSAQADRAAAYAFCESFQSRPDCVSYAFYLLQSGGHGAHHRHFALHVVETWLRVHWKSVPFEDTVMYRSTLLDIAGRHVAADEPSFLKEKLVKVLADIAKRQFPQRWPDLLEQLLQLWCVGPVQAEIVMLLFRSIAEDCVSSSFNSTIPPTRRKDILQGLNACFPTLFPLVYQQLEVQYSALQDPAGDHKPANAVLLAALQMVKEFLDWMPVATPAAPDTNFIAAASLLVQTPSLIPPLRTAAAECLEVYFSRSFGKDNLALLVATTTTCWASLGTIGVGDVDDADDFSVHLHVNRVLVSWGTHQLELLAGEFPASQEVLAPFVALLLRFFQHPSLTITEAQVIVWLNLLKQPKLVNALLLPQVVPALWTTALDKYFKLHSPDRDDAPAVSALEFEDHDAYAAFFSNFRGRLYGVLRLLIGLQPAVGIQHLHDRLQYVLSTQARGSDALDARGHCTDLSTAHVYHEGMVALIDCLMKSVPDHALADGGILATLGASVDLLLAYDTPDPWLLFRHCLALSLFAKYYVRVPGLYPRVFERLFGLIVFLQPGETLLGTMDATTMNVRRRALASLISICHASPAHVLPFLPILCNQVVGLFPVVLDSESVLMYEMLVLVSNSLPTAAERSSFVAQITAEPLATWTSPAMSAVVASPAALVQAVAANDNALVLGIVKVLTTLYGVAKRIVLSEDGPHPYTAVWPALLPNLLALLRTLHALPAEKAALFPAVSDAMGLVCMSQEEVAQALLGKETVPVLEPGLLRNARWAKNVRDICYHLLGCALSLPSFYALLDVCALAGMLDQAVVAHLDGLEHRHWKSLLSSVWLPFVKGCPESHLAPLLHPIVLRVLSHLSARLAPAFGGDSSATPAAHLPVVRGLDIQATTLETVHNAVVLEVTRHAVDFCEALVDAKTVVDADSDHPKHVVQEKDRVLRDFVLASPPLTHGLVGLLLGAMTFTDTLSARRSAVLLDRLVTLLYLRPEFGILLGKEVFTAALAALLQHFYDVDDGLKWELVNLLRNVYCRTTLGLLPVDECKGIDPVNQPRKPDDQVNPWPRHILLGLHGVETSHVVELEAALRQHPSLKAQKNLVKEFVETPFLAYRDAPHTFKTIDDLPESLVLLNKASKEPHNDDVNTGLLFTR